MTKEIDLEKLIEQAMIVMVVEYHTLAYMISKIGVEVVDNPSVPAAAYTMVKVYTSISMLLIK